MEIRKAESMKVNPKYIKEAIDEYNKSQVLNENIECNETCEINGYTYFVTDLTTEEFIRQNNLKNFEELRWT